jgi:hypothetical protein
MIEAASTSKTSINFYQTTWCNNPEDSHLHTHCHENLKSHPLWLSSSEDDVSIPECTVHIIYFTAQNVSWLMNTCFASPLHKPSCNEPKPKPLWSAEAKKTNTDNNWKYFTSTLQILANEKCPDNFLYDAKTSSHFLLLSYTMSLGRFICCQMGLPL